MIGDIEIRESLPVDIDPLGRLYADAFPDEDLVPLVRELLGEGPSVLSLVAMAGRTPAGHVVFTTCGVGGSADAAALLGPLAVAPDRRGRGIGGALVREGLRRLKAAGVAQVQVLGDPAYYGRFGFEPDDGVVPPYPLPEEWRGAWRSLSLRDGAPPLRGALSVPRPWRQRALWAP